MIGISPNRAQHGVALEHMLDRIEVKGVCMTVPVHNVHTVSQNVAVMR